MSQNILHPSLYSDQGTYEREVRELFEGRPQYVGHEQCVPDIGDYMTLAHEGDGRTLIHTSEGIRLVSNVCRHRQAIILQGTGKTKHITCPLHKWSWKDTGEMIGAPHFSQNPCKHLRTWELTNWRGLLFEGGGDVLKELEGIGYGSEINFERYRYHHSEKHHCDQNWKTFMEVYGDDYHIAPAHPGLSKMLDMSSLEVTTGEHWHIQTVSSTAILESRTTPIYEAWRQSCLATGDGKLPKYGAIWLAYYPGVMIEIYPYTITVSYLRPISPTETMNVIEFYYHEDVDDELIEREISAYMETAREDDDIGERMDAGRRALLSLEERYTFDEDELSGLYHPTMESAVEHFHEWYQERMGIDRDE